MKKEDKNLFEDINLQYMEPLEGEDEDSEKEGFSYNKYLSGVNRELTTKKEEITFVNDLGLNHNLLNIKELFNKIKRQNNSKNIKTQYSFRSLNKSIISNKIGIADPNIVEIEEKENIHSKKEEKKKKKIKKKREKSKRINISSISKFFFSKLEIKKYLNDEKRIMTYNNLNNITSYLNKNDLILNIKEKKENIRKINSGRLYKKIIDMKKKGKEKNEFSFDDDNNNTIREFDENGNYSDEYEKDDIFLFRRKKNQIIEPYYLLDDEEDEEEKKEEKNEEKSKKPESIRVKEIKSKAIIKKDVLLKEEKEKEEEKKDEEQKDENYIHPLIKLEEDIKRINMKPKKKKKINQKPQEQKIEELKNKVQSFKDLKRSLSIKTKNRDTNSKVIIKKNINSNNIMRNENPKNNRLQSPVINSILNDISSLSKLIIKNEKEKSNKREKNTIKYEKHFGYEYWKENEYRKYLLHPLTTNKRRFSSFKSINSTIVPEDNYSIASSNLSWLLKKNNNKIFNEYNDNFSFFANQDIFNPYSVNWTKKVLKNSYNRKIKLKKKISGIPEIELMSRSKSSLFSLEPKISYNLRIYIDNKNNKFFKKNSNMFGRIYNNNEVEFPFIYKS